MLVEYDSDWPRLFDDAAEALRSAGNPAWTIEHIGSTAVPGMMAKPVIDIAVRLVDQGDLDHHRPGLERGGWRAGSGVRTHRVMLFEQGGARLRIAHFFTPEQWPNAHQRVLRDWLRTHPDDAARYQHAKQEAARRATGRRSYNDAKTAVIQEIMDRARAARGLPAVNVHDKQSHAFGHEEARHPEG